MNNDCRYVPTYTYNKTLSANIKNLASVSLYRVRSLLAIVYSERNVTFITYIM